MRRQTPAIAHQMHAWQGHEGGQLLEQFRARANPRGAIGPRVGEGVDEVAVGVLRQTLQRHGPARGIADQALQLIAPVRGICVLAWREKPVDADTAGSGERGRLACGTEARAEAPDFLASPLAKGEALLHGGRQGPGQLGRSSRRG